MTKTSEPASPRLLIGLVGFALGPPALVALALALLRPADASGTLASYLLLLLGGTLVLATRSGPRGAKWLLVLCVCSLVLLWPEMGLRLRGFRFDTAGVIMFGLGSPRDTIPARRDPDLFWTLSPAKAGVNSNGFIGDEFVIPKPRGVRRIVFLGDSCTQQGFPALVERSLNAPESLAGPHDAVNLGVAGYTSHQGLAAARRWLERLEPDLVVVYFGWNDHWRAYVVTDRERSRWHRRLWTELVSASRLFQAAVRAGGERPMKRIDESRVGLEDYRDNLERIGELATSVGADVLFLTAPSSHPVLGVPDYLVEREFTLTKQIAEDDHRRYNEQVVELTRERGWALLDLEGRVLDEPVLARMFLKDGIHFSDDGLAWVADSIVEAIGGDSAPRPAGD